MHPHVLESTTYQPHPATENGLPMCIYPAHPCARAGHQLQDNSSILRLALHRVAPMFETPSSVSYSAKAPGGPAVDGCTTCDSYTHNPSIYTRRKPHALYSYTQYRHRAPMQSQRPPILPAHNLGPLVEQELPAATQSMTNVRLYLN